MKLIHFQIRRPTDDVMHRTGRPRLFDRVAAVLLVNDSSSAIIYSLMTFKSRFGLRNKKNLLGCSPWIVFITKSTRILLIIGNQLFGILLDVIIKSDLQSIIFIILLTFF